MTFIEIFEFIWRNKSILFKLVWRHITFIMFNGFALKSFISQLSDKLDKLHEAKDTAQQIQYGFETLETILEMKEKKNKTFEEIFVVLEALSNDYKKDPESIRNLFIKK